MGLGGFAPLPLRLTPDTMSAEQFMRAAADLVAARRALPFAVLRIALDELGARMLWYRGRNGCGHAALPLLISVADGCTLTWPSSYVDELGNTRPLTICHVQASAEQDPGTGALAIAQTEFDQENTLSVHLLEPGTSNPAYTAAVVKVWESTSVTLDDYGAYLDKANCETERVPYAAQYYRALQDGQGSAYSKELSGLNHAENLALARLFGWGQRMQEKWSNEQTPGTASTKLPEWCEILGSSSRAADSDSARRARAVAHYQILQGANPQQVDSAIAGLLGGWLVKIRRNWDDTMVPPTYTYWAENPGPDSWDLGGGAWLSDTANLVIEVRQPSPAEMGEFSRLMNLELRQLLDRLLPAHMTWNWCCGLDAGFVLDSGRLDFTAMR